MTTTTERHPLRRRARRLAGTLVLVGLAATAVACGGSKDEGADSGDVTIRLLAHDSFALSDGLLADFTARTGVKVELIQGGDAGTVVNQAILTNGNPQADVLFGIDSTLLTRALEEDLFVPYEAKDLAALDPAHQLDAEHRVTPVDYGDVCLNYDKAWFAEHGTPVPTSLEQLTQPAYKDLLVVENPATSSPGLAFLLSTIDHFGADGWQAWWTALRANGVEVSDSWETAYTSRFSGGSSSTGDKPLVVSYASSPPYEVLYSEPKVDDAPTGVISAGCYRQVEGAGILRGTKHEAEAGELIDFLISATVQADVPTSMFVWPVRTGTPVPDVFTRYAAVPAEVAELPADQVDAHRADWVDEWTSLVVR